MERLERQIDTEVKARFPAGSVQRVVLLQHGEDPDELLVRVFIGAGAGAEPAGDVPEDRQRTLDAWAEAHQAGMKRMRRELSLRLPEARLLEFTIDGPGAIVPITMPDDPALTSEPLSPRETVEIALSLLRASYVFPDRAERAAVAVEASLAAGDYDGLDEDALAERLTSQLHEFCDDKHLRVGTMPPRPEGHPRPRRQQQQPPDREPWERRPRNYGIYRVERLDGNVGYLDLRGVPGPEEAGPAIAAAMELVSGTYALIIDLRHNHGGSPHAVVLWCSYFFPDAGTHLNDIFDATTGETRQFWSLAYVPGARYTGRPVYVLSSAETFSGGEDFCYTLQAQGRAKVIGETTGGGAHPTRMMAISATMAIAVPFARSVNPVTGTNWQGTGVIPDIAVPAARAYDVAYRKALEHVLSVTALPPIAAEARDALAALPPG
jgi:Peptidase family S41/N-terminal domain of Peptidase_S41 in eukaryotic IRBP